MRLLTCELQFGRMRKKSGPREKFRPENIEFNLTNSINPTNEVGTQNVCR